MMQIISSISNRLYDTFGTDYDIHLEPVEQDFKTPAFSIILMPSSAYMKIMGSENNINKFDIIYYPKHDHYRQELIEMADSLKKAFRKPLPIDESVKTMEVVPASDISWRIVDDVLHFTFTLDYFVDTYESDDAEMTDLTQVYGEI